MTTELILLTLKIHYRTKPKFFTCTFSKSIFRPIFSELQNKNKLVQCKYTPYYPEQTGQWTVPRHDNITKKCYEHTHTYVTLKSSCRNLALLQTCWANKRSLTFNQLYILLSQCQLFWFKITIWSEHKISFLFCPRSYDQWVAGHNGHMTNLSSGSQLYIYWHSVSMTSSKSFFGWFVHPLFWFL